MSSDASAFPPPEIANQLTFKFEHSLYIGNYISGILYGISLILYLGTMRGLMQRNVPRTSAKARRFFAIYSTIIFALLTIDVAVNAVWSELCWINGRQLPGGVLEYISTNMAVWYQTMGSTTVVAMIFMGDALLLYRMYIIWGQQAYILVIPVLAYLAAFSLSIIQLVTAAMPGASLFGGKSINFGVPYYSITIALNIVVTLMICFRLHRLSRTVSQALGQENARMYTSVSSMLIESAAPYSIVGLIFLIPYAIGSDYALAFGQIWAKLTMIVFRVVAGKAWAKETVTRAESTVIFGANGTGGVTSGVELRSGFTQATTLGGSMGSEKWDGQKSTKSSAHEV